MFNTNYSSGGPPNMLGKNRRRPEAERRNGGMDDDTNTPHQLHDIDHRISAILSQGEFSDKLKNSITQARSDGTLDLATFPHKEISTLPPELMKLLSTRITKLSLPPGLNASPPWLKELKSIEEIDIPGYAGRQLNLCELLQLKKVRIENSETLRNVFVTERSAEDFPEVRCPGGARHKMEVHIFDDKGSCRESASALGHAYYTAFEKGGHGYGTIDSETSLNGETTMLKDYTIINCSLMAMQESFDSVDHDKDKQGRSRAQDRCKQFGDPESLQKHVNPESVVARDLLTDFGAQKSDLVGHDVLGKFLKERFESIQPGGTAHYLFESDCHSMYLRLRSKTPHTKPFYVTRLYDPNKTFTDMRCVENNLEAIQKWKLDKLLDSESADYYFGLDGALPLSASQIVSLSGSHGQGQQKRDVKLNPGNRTRAMHLPSDEKLTPLLLFMHLDGNYPLPVEKLIPFLANAETTGKEAYDLLHACSESMGPGFFQLMSRGYDPLPYCELVLLARASGRITHDQFVTLLRAESPKGIPGLYGVIVGGFDIAGFIRFLFGARKQGKLNNADLYFLLAAKKLDGTRPKFGQKPDQILFNDLVSEAHKQGWLTEEQLTSLTGGVLPLKISDSLSGPQETGLFSKTEDESVLNIFEEELNRQYDPFEDPFAELNNSPSSLFDKSKSPKK